MTMPRMIRDDAGAKAIIEARGCVVPPLFNAETGRQMFCGWRVSDGQRDHGAVILFPSVDGEDYEIMADGGWTLPEARRLFDIIFTGMGQVRVSARCRADNVRNLHVLKRMGFVEEGRKRLPDGDVIMLGMMADECRLLKKEAA